MLLHRVLLLLVWRDTPYGKAAAAAAAVAGRRYITIDFTAAQVNNEGAAWMVVDW